MLQRQLPTAAVYRARILRLRLLLLFLQKGKDAPRRCQGILELGDHAGDFIKRFGVLVGVR